MAGDIQRKPVARKFNWLRVIILSSKAQLRGVFLVSLFVNL